MLKIKNLSKSFQEKSVLKDLNANFDKGLNFILGPSGSGKSTLLKIISGMDKDYEGLITYKGKDLKDFLEKDMNSYYFNSIGFIWQNFGLIEHLSVEDNVKMVLNLTKEDQEVINEKVNLMLKRLGIGKLAKENVSKLYGGQKQRIAIARVLVKEPEVIIADEPTEALDKGTSKVIMSVLKKISKERLVIIVTHDRSLIEENSNVYKLEKGQLVKINESESNNKVKNKEDYINPMLSIKNSISISIKNFKGLLLKRILVSVVLALSAFFILLNLSGDVISKQDEILNKLIEEKGNRLREIQLLSNAISASGTDSEDEESGGASGNINIRQDPSKVLDKYMNDERIEYIIPMGIINNMKVELQGDSNKYSVENTGTYPVFNDLVEGSLPQLKGREVAVTNTFLKNNNLNPEEIIGKTISITGSAFDWSTGTPN
ncbi:ABC transporter ATP-binding protein [Clostridium sp. D53t1_180928_C8]|uniref:ABC transporter ATP-binding protein n=1 Tax=Clostridium sp. D53t1_180928_C8 TaxID=2787101 RepID=UPI0018A99E18|nr:ABC transporter ATP-binding protein [Clostridium sp. D53t1_180928_C8]